MGLSTNSFLITMFTLMVSLINDGVWAVQCRCEFVLVQEGDVRFGTRTFVVLVVNELNSLKIGGHIDVVLLLKE